MMTDTVDYGELKTEWRMIRLVFPGALFSFKPDMALGSTTLGWLLAALGHLLLIGIVTRYRLTKERCKASRGQTRSAARCCIRLMKSPAGQA